MNASSGGFIDRTTGNWISCRSGRSVLFLLIWFIVVYHFHDDFIGVLYNVNVIELPNVTLLWLPYELWLCFIYLFFRCTEVNMLAVITKAVQHPAFQ